MFVFLFAESSRRTRLTSTYIISADPVFTDEETSSMIERDAVRSLLTTETIQDILYIFHVYINLWIRPSVRLEHADDSGNFHVREREFNALDVCDGKPKVK